MFSIDDVYYSTGATMYFGDDNGVVLRKVTKKDVDRLENTEVLRIEPFMKDKKPALLVHIGRRKINRIS